MKNLYIGFLLLLSASNLLAAKVDTVQVHSSAMNKEIKAVVISPDKAASKPHATLYLLHGYGGNYAAWIKNVPHIKDLVDQYDYVVVCPDGGVRSWYWDIPGDKDYQYDTFVSKELVDYIEQHYAVSKDRRHRGITGLSMGGHGALYLAIRHQDVYGAAASTAGGVDIRPFPNNWEMSKRLGSYKDNKDKWDTHTVMELLHLIEPDSLKLFVDCGTGDFFYQVNQELHRKLTYMNIPHAYLTMPGQHNWAYWSQSIRFQMAFFDQYFTTP